MELFSISGMQVGPRSFEIPFMLTMLSCHVGGFLETRGAGFALEKFLSNTRRACHPSCPLFYYAATLSQAGGILYGCHTFRCGSLGEITSRGSEDLFPELSAKPLN